LRVVVLQVQVAILDEAADGQQIMRGVTGKNAGMADGQTSYPQMWQSLHL
jgi:hypothetical protein